jgi:hypothetical protein
MIMETRNSVKEQFISEIGSAQYFRSCKAEEFSYDIRNKRSAESLDKLGKYVENLRENHPVFGDFYSMNESQHEEFKQRLSRYGFDGEEEPEAFIQFELSLCLNKINEN